jgi:hypothetical protein
MLKFRPKGIELSSQLVDSPSQVLRMVVIAAQLMVGVHCSSKVPVKKIEY